MKSCKALQRECIAQVKAAKTACTGDKRSCRSAFKASKGACRTDFNASRGACRTDAIARCSRLPDIVLGARSTRPLGRVALTIGNHDPTAAYEIEFDLGMGAVMRTRIPPGGQPTFSFVAPLGRIDAVAGFVAGDVSVVLKATTSRGTTMSAPVLLGIEALPVWTGAPGRPIRALLAATKQLALDAKGRFENASSQVRGLDVSGVLRALDDQVARMESLAALLEGGGPVSVVGIPATIDASSVALLDRIALAYIESLPQVAGAQTRALGSDDYADFLDLPQRVSAGAREFLDAYSGAIVTGAAVVGVAAFLAGNFPVVAAASVIGAVTFMVTTTVGTALTGALDMGSAAITKGRASIEDARTTLEFFGQQYLDLAVDTIIGRIGGDVCGDLCEQIGSDGRAILDTIDRALEHAADPPASGGCSSCSCPCGCLDDCSCVDLACGGP